MSGGTLEVAAPQGTLNLAGKMSVAEDSTVKVSGPSFNAVEGSAISGAGTLLAFGTSKVVSYGSVSIANIVAQTGTILLNKDGKVSSISLTNAGTFGGAGIVNATSMDWEFGTLTGPGASYVDALSCKTSGTKTMSGRSIGVVKSATLEGDTSSRTTVNFIDGSVTIPATAKVSVVNAHTFVGLWEVQDAVGGGFQFRAQSKAVEGQ